jgi:hypothetical protein
MAKFKVIYEMEIDAGGVPAWALSEYFFKAEKDKSDWTVWEIAGDSMQIVSVEPVSEDK